MPEWKVTATTILCEAVNEEVTFIVSGEGTVTCTGHQRYAVFGKKTSRISSACAGNNCRTMLEHCKRMVGEGSKTE